MNVRIRVLLVDQKKSKKLIYRNRTISQKTEPGDGLISCDAIITVAE
jgi:hypothetical protein